MANPGKRRLPRKILELRQSRKLYDREPDPIPRDQKPSVPDWLTDAGKECWEQTTSDLDAMGLLAKTDQNALARYCDSWARWRKSQAFLAENNDVCELKDEAGNVISATKWPQVLIYERLTVILLRMEQEFGLTPSARAGLAKPKVKANKSKDRFFGKGTG